MSDEILTMNDTPKLVLIEWVDSSQPIPGWQWLADMNPRRALKCVSVGFLVQDDEKTKVLAPNLGASSGDEDWDQASGLMTIPTAAVTKIERLTSVSATALTTACGLVAA